MKNMTVKRVVQVECSATADQWQLYGLPERDAAAAELNAAFVEAVNAGKDTREIWLTMRPVQRKWDELGACDSEGFHMLERMLEEVFGDGTR